MTQPDSFGAKGTLDVAGTTYEVFRLSAVEGAADLPYSLKVLLENLLRTEDGAVAEQRVAAVLQVLDHDAGGSGVGRGGGGAGGSVGTHGGAPSGAGRRRRPGVAPGATPGSPRMVPLSAPGARSPCGP